MATIQNQAIIQKLIDELELYPALEKMPTELAEKILPVFQVNAEEVNVTLKPNYFLWQDVSLNDSDKTLTVPNGHNYVIQHGFFKFITTATVGNRGLRMEIKDKAGNLIWKGGYISQAASLTWHYRVSNLDVKEQAAERSDTINFPLSTPFILQEGFTLRVWDSSAVDVAADDLEISLMVKDIKD